MAERLATTSLCDELYEALEGFLVPREAKLRRGLDSLGEASALIYFAGVAKPALMAAAFTAVAVKFLF